MEFRRHGERISRPLPVERSSSALAIALQSREARVEWSDSNSIQIYNILRNAFYYMRNRFYFHSQGSSILLGAADRSLSTNVIA